jgi:hypothetical protein
MTKRPVSRKPQPGNALTKTTTRAQWVERIRATHLRSVEAILDIGRVLIAARDDLDRGPIPPDD